MRGQGAAGFVVINNDVDNPFSYPLLYEVPGLELSRADGATLEAWLAEGSGHVGSITGTTFTTDAGRQDVIASFSSRGPNLAADVISPTFVAPGVGIATAQGLVDDTPENDYLFASGTSLAVPHVSGAARSMVQARPGWTPGQIQSALMTTATSAVVDFDGTQATPYEQGSGRIDVSAAVRAGLLFDETPEAFLAADPRRAGDSKTLNVASFADSQCMAECTWSRRATVPTDSGVPDRVTWTPTVTSDAGLVLDVRLAPATVSPGETTSITVTARVGGAPAGSTVFGRITLTPSDPSLPPVTLPVAVEPSTAQLPDSIEVEARRNAGSHALHDLKTIPAEAFTGAVLGLVEAEQQRGELVEDPDRDPFSGTDGVALHTLHAPAGSSRLVAEVLDTEAPDLDLFVGVGETPTPESLVCVSAISGSHERCDVDNPSGPYWVLVHSFFGSTTAPDAYNLALGVVDGSVGNAGVDGPDGPVSAGATYDALVHWDLPQAEPGDVYYGTVVLGSTPSSVGDIGSVFMRLTRIEDDVTAAASVATAEPGQPVKFTVTVEPNLTDEDLAYTITDTVPDGFTLDPASVTGGGVVDGRTITWDVSQPTPVGLPGQYVVSTPADNPQCAAYAGFVDLRQFGFGFLPTLDGDSGLGRFGARFGPWELFGDEYANLLVTEDGFFTVPGGNGGLPFVPQAIPDPAAPNGVIAPLWADLEASSANGSGVIVVGQPGVFAVAQWENLFSWTPGPEIGPAVGDVQAWVYTTVEDYRPEITFEYRNLNLSALAGPATVGLENPDGTAATTILAAGDPEGVLTNGSICLDYLTPTFEPLVLSYTAVANYDAEIGPVSNRAVHVTDDPYAQPATAAANLEVVSPCDRTVTGTVPSPIQVDTGTTCIIDATVSASIDVALDARLIVHDSVLDRAPRADGATVVYCGTEVADNLQQQRSPSVVVGDPAHGCAGNVVHGVLQVNHTKGPSVIAGNVVDRNLLCTGNQRRRRTTGFPTGSPATAPASAATVANAVTTVTPHHQPATRVLTTRGQL